MSVSSWKLFFFLMWDFRKMIQVYIQCKTYLGFGTVIENICKYNLILAWYVVAPSLYLSQSWHSFLSPYGSTRPQVYGNMYLGAYQSSYIGNMVEEHQQISTKDMSTPVPISFTVTLTKAENDITMIFRLRRWWNIPRHSSIIFDSYLVN